MKHLYVILAFFSVLFVSCKKDKQAAIDEFEKIKFFDFETQKVLLSGNDFMFLSPNNFIKVSADGTFSWSQKKEYYVQKDTVISSSDNFPQAILPLDGGKAIISGITNHYNGYYCCIQFLNEDGTVSTSKRFLLNQEFPNVNEIEVKSILKTGSNLLLIGDYTDKSGNSSYFIIKTDLNANFIWKKEYLFSQSELPSAINTGVISGGGDVLLTGYSGKFIIVSAINNAGNIIWTKEYNKGNWLNEGTHIVPSTDGKFCITGYVDMSLSNSSYNYNFLMLKINPSDGSPVWFKELGTDKQDFCVSSSATPDGGFILVGTTNRQTQPVSDSKSYIYLLKLNASGEQEWIRKIGEDYALQGLYAKANEDNSYTIIGNKQGYGNSNVLHSIFIKTKPIQK